MAILRMSLAVAVSLLLLCVAAFADPVEERCAEQLRKIGRAIADYRKAREKLPGTLGELVPGYLPGTKAIRCPMGRSEGTPGEEVGGDGTEGEFDYSYEMRGVVFDGMASPMGPLPPSDLPGRPWGTERNIMLWLRRYYGDRVPVARCVHHGSKIAPRAPQPHARRTRLPGGDRVEDRR